MIEVLPVRGKRTLREFIGFPYTKYRGHPYWLPPLRLSEWERLSVRRNPFFERADAQLFLAREHGVLKGRIAAIDDRAHNEVHHENVAAFGFFEADSGDVATTLLAAAEAWARGRGRSAMRGPLSPSLNDTAGLLVDGFEDPPALMMPYNPPEYAGYVEGAGYARLKDLYAWSYRLQSEPAAVQRYTRLAARLQNRSGVTVRSINLRRFEEEMRAFHAIYCQAWKDNWGFVAPTPREFTKIGRELKLIADPRFVLCAEIDGQIVGCAIVVPDINQALSGTNGRLLPLGLWKLLIRNRLIDRMRLLVLGVLPEYRPLGIYPMFVAEILKRAVGTRYRHVELSWVLEENDDINRPAADAGAVRYKTYRLYERTWQ